MHLLPILALAATLAGCVSVNPELAALRTSFDDEGWTRQVEMDRGVALLVYECPPDRCGGARRQVLLRNSVATAQECSVGLSDSARISVSDVIPADLIRREGASGASDFQITFDRPTTRFRETLGAGASLLTATGTVRLGGEVHHARAYAACDGTRGIMGIAVAENAARAGTLAERAFRQAARQPI